MIILLVSYAQAMLKQEIYEYQIGFMITNPQEDFILSYKEAYEKSMNQKIIRVNNEIVLINEINHQMHKIIDMKQNEYVKEDYVWILYKMDNKTILSKQYIDDLSQKENYYLQLSFECYTFYFISKSQIVIDCQDSVSNIIVWHDITNKVQQSFYYSYYKKVRLRKMFQIYDSRSLVFIQQHQFMVLCLNQIKYQICNILNFDNDAHSAHLEDNQIILVSDYQVDVFDIICQDNYQVVYSNQVDLSKFYPQIKFQLEFFFIHNLHHYMVSSNIVLICYYVCTEHDLDNPPIKIDIKKNYLIIQTRSKIYIFCLNLQKLFEINKEFTDDFIIANRDLNEFYIANTSHLTTYGLTQRSYLRITNQSLLIDKINFLNHYIITNYEYEKFMILFDPNFQFKRYNLLDKFQSFLLIGGILNINIYMEKQFEDKIRVDYSHFIDMEIQQNVQQFYFDADLFSQTFLIIITKHHILQYNMIKSSLKLVNQTEIDREKLILFSNIYSFNEGYVVKDNKTGLYYFVNKDDFSLIHIGCERNFKLSFCTKQFCICSTDEILRFYFFDLRSDAEINLKEEEKFLYFDMQNNIIYLKNNTNLLISYFPKYLFHTFHIQTIRLCNNFISLVVLHFKLILVCSEQMIVYNKVSKYRYLISGNVELHGQYFGITSNVIQTQDYLFYIIDNQILHVFNSNLPLSQLYVFKMQLGKFEDVKARNQHICFNYKNKLQCYYYSINIRFLYDTDQVEYHQPFKLNICAENQFNQKCKQYITRLDQQNRRISIKQSTYQVQFNKNINIIKLDDKFYSGSVDKIFVNHLQQKPKLVLEQYIDMTYDISRQTQNFGLDNMIYTVNGQTLLIYNIETKQIWRKIIKNTIKQVVQYKSYLLLIDRTSISVLNSDQDYEEIVEQQFKISHRGLIYLYNNSLYTSQFNSLRIYSLENIDSKPLEYVDEELRINIIDFSEDDDGLLCMMHLDFKNQLIFRYRETIKMYNLIVALRQLGIIVDFGHFDAIHQIKLINNCKIVLIIAHFGSHFFELRDELIYLSQIVIFNPSLYQSNTLLIGKNYVFYIQQQDQSIFLCKFTYDQIYDSKYIDFHYKINSNSGFKDSFFHAHNDELYTVQYDQLGLIIKNIDLDNFIQVDNLNHQNQKFLVTLSNSDETKSFIIELLVETQNHIIFYWIAIVLLLICYIYLLNIKLREQEN